MRVFLSHATDDGPIARYLKSRLTGDLGVEVFMMPDEAPPGAEWIDVIKDGVRTCDELFSLVTPLAMTRPWISAEWACFWMQDKRCTPLLVDLALAQLWGPMQVYQAVDLLQPSSTERLLEHVAKATGVQPLEGVATLAHTIAEDIPEIQRRTRLAAVDKVAARVATNVQSGNDNVDPDDVATIVEAGRIDALLAIARGIDAAPVKQKQIAIALWRVGRSDEALEVAVAIPSRAEAKNVGREVVRTMPVDDGPDAPSWRLLRGLHPRVGPDQRRELLELMATRGIVPIGEWAEPPGDS